LHTDIYIWLCDVAYPGWLHVRKGLDAVLPTGRLFGRITQKDLKKVERPDKSVAEIRPILYKVPKSLFLLFFYECPRNVILLPLILTKIIFFLLKSAASEIKDLKFTKV
jgi:hypothetical protein